MMYPATKPSGQFAQIPTSILRSTDISKAGKILWAELTSQQYNLTTKGGKKKYKFSSFYGLDTIAKRLGWSKRTVREHLRELEEEGLLLTVQRGGQKTNVYFLFQPFKGKGQEISYKILLTSILANLKSTGNGAASEVKIDTLLLCDTLTNFDEN